jgi:hypothetical protein
MTKKTEQELIAEAVESLLTEEAYQVKTPVMFRRYKDRGKEVFAVFPHHANNKGELAAYDASDAHVTASPEFVTKETEPVEHSHPDAQKLGKHLSSLGYDLEHVPAMHHVKTIRRLKAPRS